MQTLEIAEEVPEQESPAVEESISETPAEITSAAVAEQAGEQLQVAVTKSNQAEEKLTNEDKEKNFQFNEICEETCSLGEQTFDSLADYKLVFEITGDAEVKIEEISYAVFEKDAPKTPETNETEEPELPANETETPGQNQTTLNETENHGEENNSAGNETTNETAAPATIATAGISTTASGSSSGGEIEQSAGLVGTPSTPSESTQPSGSGSESNPQESSGNSGQARYAQQQITQPITASAIQIPPPSLETMPLVTVIVSALCGLYAIRNLVADRLHFAMKKRKKKVHKAYHHALIKGVLRAFRFKKLRFK